MILSTKKVVCSTIAKIVIFFGHDLPVAKTCGVTQNQVCLGISTLAKQIRFNEER